MQQVCEFSRIDSRDSVQYFVLNLFGRNVLKGISFTCSIVVNMKAIQYYIIIIKSYKTKITYAIFFSFICFYIDHPWVSVCI